jgi:hypothetical protein
MANIGDESSFDKELRQAALDVFGTSRGINESVTRRNSMLQEMSRAVLVAYLEKQGSPPSPTEVQRMRLLVLSIWDDMVNTTPS